MLFVSPCESQDFLDPGGLARPPGPQKFQDTLPFLSKVLPDLLYLQAGTEFRQCPGRSEAGQRPALLLLKPEQDFLHFSFPNIKLKHSFENCSFYQSSIYVRKKQKQKGRNRYSQKPTHPEITTYGPLITSQSACCSLYIYTYKHSDVVLQN